MKQLNRLLKPKTIAVFGGGLAAEVIRQCDKIGFDGEIWPVNPKRSDMAGRKTFASVDALPAAPDAAFISVPRAATVEIVRQLAEMGAGGAVCFASGFAEMGAEGREWQTKLQAAMGDMAIIGPNCYGAINYLDGVTLWPDEHGGERVERGVALVAQSGNMSISISMQRRGVPLAYLISAGNQAGVTIPDYIDSFLDDKRVTAIGVILEGLDDVATFSAAAVKAWARGVPIVLLKSGVSEIGRQVALSHTSSLAGSDDLYNALFERYGVVRVASLPELLETLKFLSVVGVLPSNGIASISSSGGEAALMADRAVVHGLTMPALVPHQRQALFDVLGERVPLSNPLDYHTYIWTDSEAKYRCFSAMLLGEQAVTIKILDYPRPDICDLRLWEETGNLFAQAVVAAQANGVVLSTLHENLPPRIQADLIRQGVAPMLGLEECLVAMRAAAWIGGQPAPPPPLPKREGRTYLGNLEAGTKVLDELGSKRLLQDYGIGVPKSAEITQENALEQAGRIGYPLVLKILSDVIVHKSDVGGVKVGIGGSAELIAAMTAMSHLGDRFLIEQMARAPIAELILGITHDPQFGLAAVIGAGGVWVELIDDSEILLFPVLRAEVERALERLKIAPLLNGDRGSALADKSAIVETVLKLAQLAEEQAVIEADINPLFVYAEGVLAVDAVIRQWA
jgi:acetyl-CoA synthetase